MIRSISLCFLISVFLTWSADGVQSSDIVYRSLIAPSETVRFREIQRLSNDTQRLTQYLDSVAEAIEVHGAESIADRPPEASTVAAFELIGKLKTNASEQTLQKFLGGDHPELSMLAVGQLGHHRYLGSIARIAQLDRTSFYLERYAYRFAVVRALIEMNHADANDVLLRLRGRLDGQLRYHVDTFLEGRSVDDFGGDSERFDRFLERLSEQDQEEFRNRSGAAITADAQNTSGFFSEASGEPESLQRMRLKPQKYYGIEIHSKRLLFILDHSGSMKDPWYGMTRLARAKGELNKAIRELPGDVEFGIVCFHTRVHQWQEDLVEATEANKDLAIDFVNRLGYGDRTNTYGVLRVALDYDKDLEAIYLLTDGKPTIGQFVSHQSILRDILHRNRFRHLNLNTIGIAVDGFTREFLKRLADESGGEFRDAR